MLKLLIADDHLLFMEGFALLLKDKLPNSLIYQASNLNMAKTQLKLHAPIDLLLLDRTMPGVDTLQYLRGFWAIAPDLRIAILSAADSPQHVRDALGMGAVGFISKAFAPETMADAIRHMLEGGVFVPKMNQWTKNSAIASGQKLLSPRLLEVITLAASGLSNKQIANSMNITEGTVKLHFHAIFRALGASTRTAAVQKARLSGLVS